MLFVIAAIVLAVAALSLAFLWRYTTCPPYRF